MLDNCQIDEAFQSDDILNLCKSKIILAMKNARDGILADLQAKPTDKIKLALMSKPVSI